MGPTARLRDFIFLLALSHGVSSAIDFRISASTIEPFDDLPPDFEATTDASEASISQEMFDNSEDITFVSTQGSEIAQVSEFAAPRPSLKEVEELLQKGEIKLNETSSGEEKSEVGEGKVVKITGDVTTTHTPPTTPTAIITVAPTTTTTFKTIVATTTTTSAPTTTTVRSTVSTTTRPSTMVTTTTARPTPTTTLPDKNLKIDFRGIPRELLTSEEIELQEKQEDEELQNALKLLPEKEIEKKKLQEENFFAFSETEKSETVEKEETVTNNKDELAPSKIIETSKTVVALNDIEEEEKKEEIKKPESSHMLDGHVPDPIVVQQRTNPPTTTTMVPANQFARNTPNNFDAFTFQVGRNFVPRNLFEKPKSGIEAMIDMAIPQVSQTTVTPTVAPPLIGKQMVEIDLPVRIPEFAAPSTTTSSTSSSTTTTSTTTVPTTTTTQSTTTSSTTTQTPVTHDFKFPFVVPDRIKNIDKKKSIEESLKDIKDAFRRIRQLVREENEDGRELSSSEDESAAVISPRAEPTTQSAPTTTVTTTVAPTTVSTTVPTTTTSTVATTTTTVKSTTKKAEMSSEELIKAGERPSWLDLSVFADNHHSLKSTTTSTSTSTTTEQPITTSTSPPPKENIVAQLFAVTEKKKDELKEAQEKRNKESEFGGNLFDETAESGDIHPIPFSPIPSPRPSDTRSFAPPPVPPLPTSEAEIGALEASIAANNQATRSPREPITPPKAPSLQQERLPKAFRALVEDLEIEAEAEREKKILMDQLKLEETLLTTRPKKVRPTVPTSTVATTKSFLDGTLTNEVAEFFSEPNLMEDKDEKSRKDGRVHYRKSNVAGRRRRIKGRKGKLQQLQRSQQGEVKNHARIVRTQKRLVLVPEEEEIGKWVEAEEKARLSKLPSAAQPPVKGGERRTPPPAFSLGNPASMRTTPGPIQPIAITSRPYFNVNARTQVQQLQPQPDGTMALRQFISDDLSVQPEVVRPKFKPRRAIVEPHRSRSHNGGSDPKSARARDYDLAMQRVAGQIADKMFPTTKAPQEVHPIRPVPLSPKHTIRMGKRPPAVPLAAKTTDDSNSSDVDSAGVVVDPRAIRVRNRRNKHVVGISRRRRYKQGQAGFNGRRHLTALHADPIVPSGAIEVSGLIRGELPVHEGERTPLSPLSRSTPIMPPVLQPLVDRNYDRQTIDRDIRV